MNAVLRSTMLAAVVVAVSACASTREPAAAASAPVVQPATDVVDARYMATVEYLAGKRGVSVRWVNPPIKRAATVASK